MTWPKRNKFKAKATNGFPSKLESAVYDLLLVRQNVGEIREIKRQQTVVLQAGPRETRIAWKVDFSCEEIASGQELYIEAKGIETAEYRLKLKLWRANPPGALEIWKGNYKRLVLAERIERKTE